MSGSAVLLCSRARLAAEPPAGAAVVEDLCDHAERAAEAVRRSGATRAVLGLCRRPSTELLAALRRAGAEPFGIEAVVLDGRPPEESTRLIEAAQAKLDALPADERGRPTLNGGAVSRRTLFSARGALMHAPAAVIDRSVCVGGARCGLCIDSCPTKAISAGSTTPAIDVESCTACGLCVGHCPHGALRISGSSSRQIEAQLERLAPDVDGVVLACAAARAEAPPRWALVELPALGLATPGWVLQLHARGIEVRLAGCTGPCCASVPAVQECVDRVVELGVLRESDAEPIRLAEPAATVGALRAFVGGEGTGAIVASASPLGLLRLEEERCTLCSACATACPTEALRFDETPEETVLRFTAAACVACGRCTKACPENALAVEHGIDLVRLGRGAVDLIRAGRERCPGCGADLPPRAMRRRLRELLPEHAGVPLELCAGCAAKASRAQSRTIAGTS